MFLLVLVLVLESIARTPTQALAGTRTRKHGSYSKVPPLAEPIFHPDRRAVHRLSLEVRRWAVLGFRTALQRAVE